MLLRCISAIDFILQPSILLPLLPAAAEAGQINFADGSQFR
jgi:hypothetical protein